MTPMVPFEQRVRWIVAGLLLGLFPLVAWSGGCSNQQTIVQPDGAAGASGGTSGTGTGGTAGTTDTGGSGGNGGTTGAGGDAGSTGAGGSSGTTGGQAGGGGGTSGAGGQPGGSGGGSGQAGGRECCAAPATRCSDDRRQLLDCRLVAAGSGCQPDAGSSSAYGYVFVVSQTCANACVTNDAGAGAICQ
jgi:hypothetical protein